MTKDILELEAVKSKIWMMFDVLRLEQSVTSDFDYHVVLLLLSAYKDNLISIDLGNENQLLKEKLIEQLRNPNNEFYVQYAPVLQSFEPSIQRLSENGIKHLFSVLVEINKHILTENFPNIFDSVLYRISQSQGRFAGEFIQPVELTRFMFGLADLNKDAKVFNPFAGLASFSVYFDGDMNYFGQELNQKTWALGALRLMAYDKLQISRYECGDSILHWPDHSENFDLIISNPPFGMRLEQYYRNHDTNIRTIEQFLIEKGVSNIKKDGKLVISISQGFLYRSGEDQRIRRFLIENDLIEMIIALPTGLLINSNISTIILVISKNKKEKGEVKFVDTNKYLENSSSRINKIKYEEVLNDIKDSVVSHSVKMISNDLIIENDYNLNLSRYFINSDIEVNKGEEVINFKDIANVIRGQRVIDGQIGKFVRIKDLKNNSFEFHLELEKIEEVEIPKSALKIEESCLLIASRGKSIKPSYFSYKGNHIYISPDIVALKVDESKILIGYLLKELYSEYIINQIESYRIGATIPMINKTDLLQIRIKIPTLYDQQKDIMYAVNSVLADEKKKELQLFNKIHGLENEIVEQNTYLRHILAGPSTNLKDSIFNIKKIIQDQLLPNNPDLLQLKISENHLVTLGEYLNIIERDANKIVNTVSSQLKVNTGVESKKIYPIEILGFIENYCNEYNERPNLNFNVKFDFDKEVLLNNDGVRIKVFINANDDLLRDLFDNLIENAVKHAFNANDSNRIEFYLMMYNDDDQADEVQILVSNNGIPFPLDFNFNHFIRKGLKYGVNSGDGYGGWYINEIIKYLGGKFDIIDEHGSEGIPGTDLATTFKINLPLLETDEQV